MSKTKELIICISAIMLLLLAITTNVFATVPDINALANSANNSEFNTIPEENNTTENNVVANNTATNNVTGSTSINNVTPANTNNTSNVSTMPNTGVDYSVLLIIAVCAISAIYAYKKIREYNV